MLRAYFVIVRTAVFAGLLWLAVLVPALAQVPGAPQNLATYQGNTQVSLSWTAPTGTVTSYNIYRGTASGSEVKVASTTTLPTVTSPYPDTGLVNGQIYYYEITAVNGSGEGPLSSEKSSTPNVYLDCGSGPMAYTDMGHHVYATDNGSISGSTIVTSSNSISNTSDPAIYQVQRAASTTTKGASFTYTINNIVNGSYMLGLYFAEVQGKTAGQRIFNVTVNGLQALSSYDIFVKAGGANTSRKETVPVIITNGTLTVKFTNQTGAATVAALVLAPASPVVDVPPPGWAADVVPTDDGTDADGAGPGSSLGVSLPSGVEEITPGVDADAYNPLGPSPVYARMWRGNRAAAGYGSPGLSAGWTDNYDLSIVKSGSTSTLTYPNGALETWTGSSGLLATPSGADYTASYDSTADAYTVQYKDRSVLTFTRFSTPSGKYTNTNMYLLTKMTNIVGHFININRDTGASLGHHITTTTNDAGTALLTFFYDGNNKFASVRDTASPNSSEWRKVSYTFATDTKLLSRVSQVDDYNTKGSDLWQYTYQTIGGQPYVSTVKTPDPSSPGSYSAASVNYDSAGHVQSHTDANGNLRFYGYSGGSVLVSVQSAGGSLAEQWTVPFLSGSGNNVDAGLIDSSGHRATNYYLSPPAPYTSIPSPSPYLPSVLINRNKQAVPLTYDTNNTYGNVLTALSPRSTQVAYTYDYSAATGFPLLGQVTVVQESHLSNGFGSTADTTKQETDITYRTDGVYDGLVNSVLAPQPDTVGGSSKVTTQYTYTGNMTSSLGNVSRIDMPGPNSGGALVSTSFNYTSDGSYSQSEAVGEPITVTDPNNNTTHLRYDGRGNLISSTDAFGYETDFFYNVANQMVAMVYPKANASATSSAFTYTTYQYVGGPVDNVALYPEGTLPSNPLPGSAFPTFSGTAFRKTSYTYDAEGEVTKTADLVGTVSTMAYDGRGRVSKVTDGVGNATFYNYTGNGSLAQVQYPGSGGSGTILSAGTPDTLTYTYDGDQNVTGETDGRGVVTSYTLDMQDSLVDGISYTNLGTATDIGTIGFMYDGYGRRTMLTDYSGSKTYVYDDLDELTSQTTRFNDTSGNPVGPIIGQTLAFAHFDNGQRASLTLPTSVSNPVTLNGGKFTYGYDPGGRLTRLVCPWYVSTDFKSVPEGISYLYQPNNWLMESVGGVHDADYKYNARGFLTELKNSSQAPQTAGDVICDYTMPSYDAAGNRLQMNANFFPQGAPDLTRTVTYGYDGRDQLTGEKSVSSFGTANYTNGFLYDLAFNPTTFRSNAVSPSANKDNQRTDLGSFDGNGNPTIYQGSTFGFDVLDRLNNIGSSFFARYDGDGLRTVKNANNTSTYYLTDEDGTPVVEETNSGTTAMLSALHAFGADGLRERELVGSGFFYAYSFDPQGSVQTRTSNSTTLATTFNDEELYDAYGGFLFDQTPSGLVRGYTPDPIGFGGQWGYYTDTETRLLNLTHRYYDAGAGRFLNRDPIGYGGGINLYGFAGNNPVMGQDPSGLSQDMDKKGGKNTLRLSFAAFIPSATAGLLFKGDGRTTNSDTASYRMEVNMEINKTTHQVTFQNLAGTSVMALVIPLHDDGNKMKSSYAYNGNGNYSIQLQGEVANKFTYGLSHLSLQYWINIYVDGKGNVKVQGPGYHTNYPAFELYSYASDRSPRLDYYYYPNGYGLNGLTSTHQLGHPYVPFFDKGTIYAISKYVGDKP